MNDSKYQIGDKVELRHQNGEITQVKFHWVHGGTGEIIPYSKPHYIVTFADGKTGEAMDDSLKPANATDVELTARREHYGMIARQSEDVSLEAAQRASQKPATKTATVKVYDTELGWVTEEITIKEDKNDATR